MLCRGACCVRAAARAVGTRDAAFTSTARALGASGKQMTVGNMNQNIVQAEYAVRGELVLKSMEYDAMLARGEGAHLPFDKTIACNIGNPQALKQKPITFHRQVLSLVNFPDALDNPAIVDAYPKDAVARARSIVEGMPNGLGAYSESKGVATLRQSVAGFIENRDGYPADPESIFLTDGASPAVQMMLTALINDPTDGILVPIPQYPLYSAGIALNGGRLVEYYLDEEEGWAMPASEIAERGGACIGCGTRGWWAPKPCAPPPAAGVASLSRSTAARRVDIKPSI